MGEPDEVGGKWWLVTWTTFGSWLPGDPRGFRTWRGEQDIPPPQRYSKPGDPVYDPAKYIGLYQQAQRALTQPPVLLSDEEVKQAASAIVAEIPLTPVTPSIFSLGTVHAHLLAKFRKSIRMTVGRLKFAATKRLHENGFTLKRVWSRGSHMSSKEASADAQAAFRYVERHRLEGAFVHVWRSPD